MQWLNRKARWIALKTKAHWIAFTVIAIPVLLGSVIVLPPVLLEASYHWSGMTGLTAQDRVKAISDLRNALLQALAGVAVAATVYFSGRTFQLNRRGQLTDRFTKAIEQLGKPELDVRLGGIYALEQIARDSEELQGPIMETLSAFLREHTREQARADGQSGRRGLGNFLRVQVPPGTDPDETMSQLSAPSVRADFQAIVTVLGRRPVRRGVAGQSVDLRGVALPHADFRGAQLERAQFEGAQLNGATFPEAHLEGADFSGAHLEETHFERAHLEEADFNEAHLEGARFDRAQLEEAYFSGAQLEGAYFWRAQLEKAHFERAHLERARFGGAQLKGAFFRRAQLKGADFSGAQLEGTHFERAHLDEAYLIEALGLTWPQLVDAYDVNKAILPSYITDAYDVGERDVALREPPRIDGQEGQAHVPD
jgi:uncharacterized protein YjbI with pentapeptide repeats